MTGTRVEVLQGQLGVGEKDVCTCVGAEASLGRLGWHGKQVDIGRRRAHTTAKAANAMHGDDNLKHDKIRSGGYAVEMGVFMKASRRLRNSGSLRSSQRRKSL